MIGIINRGNLPDTVQAEFENLIARFREIFLKEHNEDGTHITSAAAVNFVPVGGMLDWGTNTAPTGWALCDGSQKSRLTYKGLFDVIGTTYGAGDGSTTFNVPDFRGRFALSKAAAGTGNTLAGTGGSLDHTHSGGTTSSDGATTTSSDGATTTSSDGGHTHTGPSHTHSGTTDAVFFTTELVEAGANPWGIASDDHEHVHGFTTDAAGTGATSSDGAHTHTIGNHTHTIGAHTHTVATTGANNPAYLVVNKIIFTGVM